MTLDQLRIYVEVAERGHVTRAAEALGMSQSAVSAAIATLEATYQITLFDRVGRGIQLTETGRTFLREEKGGGFSDPGSTASNESDFVGKTHGFLNLLPKVND